jgi:hydrogenase maturation protein HypF
MGFRPFVCTLANELGVSGSVRNQGGQVEIVARGDAHRAALFLRRVMSEHPPIARPADRRFHAQVMACADCGPGLCFQGERGNEAAITRTVLLLRDGAIVAVKGIGGYHLLCDASNTFAVRRLRARKHRPGKPPAVLFPRAGANGLGIFRRSCAPTVEAARSPCAPEGPIVLVARRDGGCLSPALAPGRPEPGALLPYSPLHELIAGDFGAPPIATSGNVSGEPVLTDQAEAEDRLGSIADAFLHHDRPILHPADDGVVRVIAARPRALRLGRGSAPLRLALPWPLDQLMLALGGQTKATPARRSACACWKAARWGSA